jgi:DNA-binding transcriptional ArsR family regulator
MMHIDAFQAIADPARRRVIEALRAGERQVGDIVKDAGIHQSGVSRHLRILHDAGFVTVRPEHQRRFYSLRPELFRELYGWLAGYRGLWEERECGDRANLPRAAGGVVGALDDFRWF